MDRQQEGTCSQDFIDKIEARLKKGGRVSTDELGVLFSAPLLDLARLSEIVKMRYHSDRITTYVVDRNINYTNICWVDCKFCAFKEKLGSKDGYILPFSEIDKKIDELIDIGGTQILFQGGVHPKLDISYYEDLVEHIHTRYPEITIHGFSAIEIAYIAKVSHLSVDEVLKRLKAKGLASIPGAGAEVLSDRVRDIIAPLKLDSSEWIDIHRHAHNNGLKTTATMMFGSVDNDADIIEHYRVVRDLQDETSGFRAFIIWSFQPSHTPLHEDFPEIYSASSNRYLRLLALARIYLDNVPNLQSSWVTQGSYIGQLALLFGANDLGSTMMEENVVASTGVQNSMNEEEMIDLIKDLGLIPAKRNTAYEILQTY